MNKYFQLCFFFLSCFVQIHAKTVYFVPYDPPSLTKNLYEYSPATPNKDLSYWQLLAKTVHSKGYAFQPTNLHDFIAPPPLNRKLEKDDRILCMDGPHWISPHWIESLKKLAHEKMVLIAYEPPSVRPWLYSPQTLSLFGKVLTWNDALVDNVKFIKYFYPDLKPMLAN